MKEPIKITTASPPYKSMDYNFLKSEAIKLAQQLSGDIWTDYNSHDPGVTILENLCYAITDLGYRTNFDIEDILKNKLEEGLENDNAFYPPHKILPSSPITPTDYRKFFIDKIMLDDVQREGLRIVTNAWIEPSLNNPMSIKGLYRVLVQVDDNYSGLEKEIIAKIEESYHENRNLAEDIDEIKILKAFPIGVSAELELEADAIPETVMAHLLFKLELAVSPRIKQYTWKELKEEGYRMEEIFDGPLPKHGFVKNEHLNDRIQVVFRTKLEKSISSLKGVRRLKSFDFFMRGIKIDDEVITLDKNVDVFPVIETIRQFEKTGVIPIKLYQNKVQVEVDYYSTMHILGGLWDSQESGRMMDYEDLTVRSNKKKTRQGIDNFLPIKHQFPAVYGIGKSGLPAGVSMKRKAQANQLIGFLFIFDQIFSDYLSQLAHLRQLFSTNPLTQNTFFSRIPAQANLDEINLRTIIRTKVILDKRNFSPSNRPDQSSRYERFVNKVKKASEELSQGSKLKISNVKRLKRDFNSPEEKLFNFSFKVSQHPSDSNEDKKVVEDSQLIFSHVLFVRSYLRQQMSQETREHFIREEGDVILKGLNKFSKKEIYRLFIIYKLEQYSLQKAKTEFESLSKEIKDKLLTDKYSTEKTAKAIFSKWLIFFGSMKFRWTKEVIKQIIEDLEEMSVYLMMQKVIDFYIRDWQEKKIVEKLSSLTVSQKIKILRSWFQGNQSQFDTQGTLKGIGKDELHEIKGLQEFLEQDLFHFGEDIKTIVKNKDHFYSRRNRFVDHLLSRFGEQFNDEQLLEVHMEIGKEDKVVLQKEILDAKLNMLNHTKDWTKYRSKAYNYRRELDKNNTSGIVNKICYSLGLEPSGYSSLTSVAEQSGLLFSNSNDPSSDHLTQLNDFLNHAHIEAYYTISEGQESDSYILTFHSPETSSAFELKESSSIDDLIHFKNKIIELVQMIQKSSEGFHLLEHILLRPRRSRRYRYGIREVVNGDEQFLASKWFDNEDLQLFQADLIDLGRNLKNYTVQYRGREENSYMIILKDSEQKILASTLNNSRIDTLSQANAVRDAFIKKVNAIHEGLKTSETFMSSQIEHQHEEKFGLNPHPLIREFYSYRLSLFFPSWCPRLSNSEFRTLFRTLVEKNIPAHLTVDIHWLSINQMKDYERLFGEWTQALNNYYSPDNNEFMKEKHLGTLDEISSKFLEFILIELGEHKELKELNE